MNCSACGKANANGVSFCEFCGANCALMDRPRTLRRQVPLRRPRSLRPLRPQRSRKWGNRSSMPSRWERSSLVRE